MISVFCDPEEAEMTDSQICSLQSFHVQHVDTQNEDADAVRCVLTSREQKKNGKKEQAYLIPIDPVQVRNSVVGRKVVQNAPYRGPTTHEETRAAMFHVKSPGNAGGGPDIDIVMVRESVPSRSRVQASNAPTC